MISRTDLVLLLTNLQEKGYDVNSDIISLYQNPGSTVHIDILRKINAVRPLDLAKFYEKIRSSYNNKKSKLYINIMKSDENAISDVKTILTTLSAMLNQILQYEAEDKSMFYTHARADEIVKVLEIYFKTKNIDPAHKLLTLIKADIKILDTIR